MKSLKRVLKSAAIAVLIGTSAIVASAVLAKEARADFGELDILIQESIEAHFREYDRAVDLKRLTYVSEPQLNEGTLVFRTSVWAEQRLIAPNWGWHDCTTVIEVKAPGQFVDLGSECAFDFD